MTFILFNAVLGNFVIVNLFIANMLEGFQKSEIQETKETSNKFLRLEDIHYL
jgi:hypothetical protein